MEKKFLNRNLHTHFVWFFKTWIFTFENWCFQTFEFPSPRLQCIYWNFFLHQRNVQKHFQFDEAEHCEEKCTICIKKNLMWLSRFLPFLFNTFFWHWSIFSKSQASWGEIRRVQAIIDVCYRYSTKRHISPKKNST